ncbi:MAG: hypothetical protein HC893_05820 [Chloroflexaceae bacterium]|nr:hypothetical protein [Chloroflexaceae bacterium]
MAVNVQRLFPLRQAKARRRELSRYLKLDGSRYLLAVVILLCLMSMIALGQTGIVATKGYAIVALEAQRTDLLRERSQLHFRHAEAQSLDHIRSRAEQIGLRTMTREQVRYVTIENQQPAGVQDDMHQAMNTP